jgi:pSer/pThr/pTyr-binding forkhead associated (FHA) protein
MAFAALTGVYGTEVIVREHRSKNCTFVDGRRISGQMPVNAGQVIRFGTVEVRLELGPEDETGFDATSDLTAVHLHNNLMQKARIRRP